MKNLQFALTALIGVSTLSAALPLAVLAAPQPKYTTKEIMKALHKGDDSIGKKVSKGEGTAEDFKKLVEYYTSLPLNEPTQGDAAVWKKKTLALLASAKALEAGKSGALDQYKEAVNCKSCHSEFKPKYYHGK
jgi:cytochrome c556